MDRTDIACRMKAYEAHETQRQFLPLLPIYCRIDGRSFSALTRGMRRPYDLAMSNSMIDTMRTLVEKTNALIGYTQSDEISLVWKVESTASGMFFDGKVQKMTSVLAGLATAAFCVAVRRHFDDFEALQDRLPHFDARVIQLPTETEAANMFLWRNMDATKNAVSMAAHHHFSHKSLQGVSSAAMQERLFSEAGLNFNDYPPSFKRGTWARRVTCTRKLAEAERARIPEHKRPAPETTFIRSSVEDFDLPPFIKITNREDVIFRGAAPEVLTAPAPISESVVPA